MADENQPQAPKKGLGAVLDEAKEGARALKEKVQLEHWRQSLGAMQKYSWTKPVPRVSCVLAVKIA